jgi:large subunit ribosomal protein L7/L12
VRDLDELSHAPATVRVVLVASRERKIEVIKEVRGLTGLGLKEAKDLVEAAPTIVGQAVPMVQAYAMKRVLESAGAAVIVV